MLQFYAGDFFSIFPQLREKYGEREDVNGWCRAKAPGVEVFKGFDDTFKTKINFLCSLEVRGDKFVDFSVWLNLAIEGHPN